MAIKFSGRFMLIRVYGVLSLGALNAGHLSVPVGDIIPGPAVKSRVNMNVYLHRSQTQYYWRFSVNRRVVYVHLLACMCI